jgi:4-methylaminobutanoate oxidase (formaldehyde-forming)
MRETHIANIPVQLVRVTFVGELGYELYAPSERGLELWEALWNAGQSYGIVACGYKAIDSLRAEKGYLYWGSDISPDESPYEAGLHFAVSKEKDFRGKKALTEKVPGKKLVTVILADPAAVVLGNEPLRMNGRVTGRVTSGAYGAQLNVSIAFAYLPVESAITDGAVEILVFGHWITGKITKGPLYDPKGLRVRI